MTLEKTRLILGLFSDALSLDEMSSEDGLPVLMAAMSQELKDPAEDAERTAFKKNVMRILGELDERSREVLVLRFGLNGDDVMTLEEVGRHFNVTRERIRQIETKALRMLSHERIRTILAPFLEENSARNPYLFSLSPRELFS